MGMAESPPPTVEQLRSLLMHIADQVEDGSPKMMLRYNLRMAIAHVDWLVQMHPELSRKL